MVQMVCRIGAEGKRMTTPSRARWTKEDEDRLRQLFLQNALPSEIAEIMGRTVTSVKSKAHALGMTIARLSNRRRGGLPRWG